MSIVERPRLRFDSDRKDHQVIEVRLATSANDWRDVLRIRREVFVVEQGLVDSAIQEQDDDWSWTCLVDINGVPAATGRLTPPRGNHPAFIAWVATRKRFRGLGAATLLVERLMDISTQAGFDTIILNAQFPVVNLYRRFGFEPRGRSVTLRTIEHQPMIWKKQ